MKVFVNFEEVIFDYWEKEALLELLHWQVGSFLLASPGKPKEAPSLCKQNVGSVPT